MIDFVIIWVDGNDPEWQKEYYKYAPTSKQTTNKRTIRYRDWYLLRYWFRGVEKFAPWVNKVYFVTCGQVPEWLNLEAPKLHFVKHADYIPQEYLPTFSSHPIELNLHRIQGLSEQFVYFNDDFYLIDKVDPDDFFCKGKPCDMAICNTVSPTGIAHILINDLFLINRSFNKYSVMRRQSGKWYNWKYGKNMLRNIALLPWANFTGFFDPHLPCPFLKSTFEEVWNTFPEELSQTSSHKFRDISDVNQYLFRYWQLVKGNFHPYNVGKNGVMYNVTDCNIANVEKDILSQRKKMIVLNDTDDISFEEAKDRLQRAFLQILPEKSSFEK